MKKKTKKIEWKDMGGNSILRAKWGGISYNPDTSAGHMLAGVITDILNVLGQEVEDGEETALYDKKKWRILTGDFRKEYEEAFPSLRKCLAVYRKYKKKYRNNYSTD